MTEKEFRTGAPLSALEATEAECAAGRTAPRVSLDDIKANIAAQYTFTAGRALDAMILPAHTSLDLLTVCLIVLRNGFTIIGKSAPASPGNFDAELGAKLAYEDAVRQVWPLMGYALREKLWAGPSPLHSHVETMQVLASGYLTPGPYMSHTEGRHLTADADRDAAFIGDMIYMLDGPEQRAAQGK
jgi:hypothetical protein